MPVARTTTPWSAISFIRFRPAAAFFAWPRLIARPAPWHDEPNVSAIAPGSPAQTHDAVPMLPGTMTGWPTARYADGTSAWPAGNARVAPFRWTHTRRVR